MAAGYRFRTSLPITLRLALGAIAGRVVDNRELLASSFLPSQFGQADWSGYFFARPELRVGYRVSDQVELSAGVGALVLVALAQPSWRGQDAQLLASTGELARFNDQTIVGRTILLITPGLGARYSF